MRKSFLAAIMLAMGVGCLPIAADSPSVLKGEYFSVFPAKYSADGKPFLFTYDQGNSYYDDDDIRRFYVYDEDMRFVKEIGPIVPNVYESKHYSQQRADAYEYLEPSGPEEIWGNVLEINGVSTGLSIDRVQSYLYALNGRGEIATLPDGTKVVALDFYGEESYGNKYPYIYYREIDGVWQDCRQYYEGRNWGPFGEWREVEEQVSHQTASPEWLHIYPESGGEYGDFVLSSGIFSDDYNYILPIYEARNFEDNSEYPEKPGWIYYKSWGTRYEQTGFAVYDSNAKEVMSILFPSGYNGEYADLNFFQMGNNRYIGIDDVRDSERNYYLLVYRLGEGNSVSFVTAAPSSKVSPRNPKRGEKVRVTFDSPVVKDGAMVQVVSASGQTMLNTKIPAGQTQLDINTSAFSQGMYVVTVSGNGTSKEAAKIIVR